MAKRVIIEEDKKKCSICKENLHISNFRKNTSLTCGLHSQCNSCEKKNRNLNRKTKHKSGLSVQKVESIKTRFKLEAEDYLKMIKEQDNKCAICGKEESHTDFRNKSQKALSIDHDHKTGEIRKLLCNACNIALGLFKEDKEVLLSAINYLKEHKKEK